MILNKGRLTIINQISHFQRFNVRTVFTFSANILNKSFERKCKNSQFDSNSTKLYPCFSRQIHYDMVISGAGSVGYSLACSIKNSKYLSEKSFLLVERQPELVPDLENSQFPLTRSRVFLTNPISLDFFKRLGIYEQIKDKGVQLIEKIKVWDEYVGYMELNGLDETEKNSDIICGMVDNNLLVGNLYQKLKNQAEKTKDLQRLVYETEIVGYSDTGETVTVELSNGETVTTDLLIACDGHKSKVRELAGIGTFEFDYGVQDTVATVTHSKDIINRHAYKKFTSHGSIAMLSLGPGVTSLSWCADEPYGSYLKNLTDEELIKELNKQMKIKVGNDGVLSFGRKLIEYGSMALRAGSITSLYENPSKAIPYEFESIYPNSRLTYPLRLILAKQMVKGKVVLLGDAAHRIHPITGQGLNLGIKDVIEFTKLLEESYLVGIDTVSSNLLQQYQRERYLNVISHVAFGTGIKYLFSNENQILTALRSFGLISFNNLPFKDILVKRSTN